jgi:hypothetical protein
MLLSFSVSHPAPRMKDIQGWPKTLIARTDIARLPSSKSTLPNYEKASLGNVAYQAGMTEIDVPRSVMFAATITSLCLVHLAGVTIADPVPGSGIRLNCNTLYQIDFSTGLKTGSDLFTMMIGIGQLIRGNGASEDRRVGQGPTIHFLSTQHQDYRGLQQPDSRCPVDPGCEKREV